MDFSKMSDEEVEKHQQSLSEERSQLKERQLEAQAEMDRRAVLRKVNAMSDEEKNALAQVLGVDGIPSEEAVGEAS